MRTIKIGVIILVLFTLYSCFGYAPPGPKTLPDILLKEMSGNHINLRNYQNNILIINFWATWCGPCKEEIPDLNELHDSFKKNGVIILGITSDRKEDVELFLKNHPVRYPIFIDAEQAEDAFSVSGYPMTYFYNAQGQLFTQAFGRRDKSFFEETISQMLK